MCKEYFTEWNPTLKAALKFYCNADLQSAHNAMEDSRAIVDIFKDSLPGTESTRL